MHPTHPSAYPNHPSARPICFSAALLVFVFSATLLSAAPSAEAPPAAAPESAAPCVLPPDDIPADSEEVVITTLPGITVDTKLRQVRLEGFVCLQEGYLE